MTPKIHPEKKGKMRGKNGCPIFQKKPEKDTK